MDVYGVLDVSLTNQFADDQSADNTPDECTLVVVGAFAILS